MRTRLLIGLLVVGLLPAAGCKRLIYRQTGDTMASYAVDHLLPTLLATDDADVACETGVSFAALLTSFARVTDDPDRAALTAWLSAASCAEVAAREAELRGLRAIQAGGASEARDARIVQKRAHQLSAQRYARAWQHLQAAYGPVGDGACPALPRRDDELLYLLGLTSGVLALKHDRAAGGPTEIGMDLPPRVARGTHCLADEAWFGVPAAIRGSIGASVPGSGTDGTEPWSILAEAAGTGDAARVRLARALQVQAAAAAGRAELVRETLAAYARAGAADPAEPRWQLLEQLGTLIVRHESDKIWTEATGHRTPQGALGRLPDEASAPAPADDSLLDGLLEDTE